MDAENSSCKVPTKENIPNIQCCELRTCCLSRWISSGLACQQDSVTHLLKAVRSSFFSSDDCIGKIEATHNFHQVESTLLPSQYVSGQSKAISAVCVEGNFPILYGPNLSSSKLLDHRMYISDQFYYKKLYNFFQFLKVQVRGCSILTYYHGENHKWALHVEDNAFYVSPYSSLESPKCWFIISKTDVPMFEFLSRHLFNCTISNTTFLNLLGKSCPYEEMVQEELQFVDIFTILHGNKGAHAVSIPHGSSCIASHAHPPQIMGHSVHNHDAVGGLSHPTCERLMMDKGCTLTDESNCEFLPCSEHPSIPICDFVKTEAFISTADNFQSQTDDTNNTPAANGKVGFGNNSKSKDCNFHSKVQKRRLFSSFVGGTLVECPLCGKSFKGGKKSLSSLNHHVKVRHPHCSSELISRLKAKYFRPCLPKYKMGKTKGRMKLI